MKLVDKYRPKNLSEVVGQDSIIKSIRNVLKKEDIPDFLFLGPAGCGKTSTAECMAKKIFGEDWKNSFIEFNASDERGIPIVRGRIKKLSRIVGKKIIFLDEADNMTPDAQQAMRRIMERTKNTIFILSGNRKWKIIEPIKSRCAEYHFKRLSDKVILKKLIEICRKEGVTITKESMSGFIALVEGVRGDLRKAINQLETLITGKKEITEDSVILLAKLKNIGNSLEFALNGNFEKAKEIMEDSYINSRFSASDIIDELYDAIGELDKEKYRKIKIRLYVKLAETERNCKYGTVSPIIQLVGFIAFVWASPHMSDTCPVLKGG